MVDILLRGITWEHRRAVHPLVNTIAAFRKRHPEIGVAWDSRPLHGFEFTPVEELAARYDLIILDHPFAGDIAAKQYLLPLDALANSEALADVFVGPSLETYRYDGHLWALPVDAACQVAVYRPDLLARRGGQPPRSWAEMMALGDQGTRLGLKLAVAFAGVHSLMTFFTLCANLGRPCAITPSDPLVDRDTAAEALEAMRRLIDFCPPEALDWNSIALHDAMVARDDLVYCPAVYCYAAYAEADIPRPLAFADLPGLRRASPAGSTVGGTGVGVSARTAHPEAALAYVRFLMEAETQRQFALNHGQPARLDAWRDPALNARFGNCFRDTLPTMEQAWIRPRYAGYLRFQRAGGDLVEAHLRGAIGEAALLEQLQALHASRGVA
ncbi:extracellular solute-binding protein [Rhodospirillaceae bacterium SYSU D60014]|uniref:ABC transporter substrate-binding protein n=1 Tax=Virgifigura deserti TaxID=2268457 RepID=UPI000E671103